MQPHNIDTWALLLNDGSNYLYMSHITFKILNSKGFRFMVTQYDFTSGYRFKHGQIQVAAKRLLLSYPQQDGENRDAITHSYPYIGNCCVWCIGISSPIDDIIAFSHYKNIIMHINIATKIQPNIIHQTRNGLNQRRYIYCC